MKLIEDGVQDIDKKDYANALEKLLTAESFATVNGWNDLLWKIKHDIGFLYFYISNYAEALNYFQESFKLTQNVKILISKGAAPLTGIGVLYETEKKYEESLYYMLKSYNLINEPIDEIEFKIKKYTVINIANVYNKLDLPDESLKILKKEKDSIRNIGFDLMWKKVYAESIFKKGEINKALNIVNDIHNELIMGKEEDYRKECYSCIIIFLSEIYAKKDNYDLAIYYSKKGLQNNVDLVDKVELYNNISDFYLKKRDYPKALAYKDSTYQAKDSLNATINRSLFETYKVKFKVFEYQTELTNKKQQQQTERIIFAGAIVFVIFIALFIYKTMKNWVNDKNIKMIITNLKLEKGKKEQILTEENLKAVKHQALLRQEQLKNKIAQKNREIFVKTIYQTDRNNLIRQIINSLNEGDITHYNETVRQMKSFLKTDDAQQDFMRHFESVNSDFLNNLKTKHPKLTARDLRFLSYVYMNLNLKEISSVFNITYDACRARKNRIIKKMGVEKEDISLYEYLLNLQTINISN
ncbi:hypothetical protein EI546_02355 [Aequorivita sp. H23M31]|uniref:Tetratricopeptide repeat protein n=1 Tax=Aequorivita ciconiae TaxID=2494375 RepID=A0A410G049_9FLAO|nr:tetratricopeptide repeat protein [Aequorivita sp. H23M31]QAA80639.1 hypothetical protein EI546_02355 [Aequorivita sp. H23M31]